MGIVMSMALPVWSQVARRERELELIFRGEQYARAIELYQRVYAGAYPPDIDTLIEQRFLRRRYRDPMVADGEFRIVYQAEASELLGGPAAAAAGPGAPDDSDGAAEPAAARRASGFGAPAATPFAAGGEDLVNGHPAGFPPGGCGPEARDTIAACFAFGVAGRNEVGHDFAVTADRDSLPVFGGTEELGKTGLGFRGLDLTHTSDPSL